MGGLTKDQRCLVLSLVLAAILGLLAAVIMGGPGQMGWWSAVGLGVIVAVVLALFFVFVLCGRLQGFDSAARGAETGSLAKVAPPTPAAPTPAAPTPAPPTPAPPTAAPPTAAPPTAAPPTAAPPTAAMSVPVAAPAVEKVSATPDDSAVAAAGDGTKPKGLPAPREGGADDLKTIEGIGPVLEKLCHDMGVFHFDQIAGWAAPEVAWMNANLKGFKGRVSRDKWVAQACLIGEVGIEEFKRRAATNDY